MMCVLCRRLYAKGMPDQICAECVRYRAYGVIVDACVGNGVGLEVLDALSALMVISTRLRRQRNVEMFEEQRYAQHDARAAYADGVAAGRDGEW